VSVVLVEVTDEGSNKVPSLCPADDRSEQGYGLALVDAAAARWGYTAAKLAGKMIKLASLGSGDLARLDEILARLRAGRPDRPAR
jgi:hypothetical protein